MSLPNIYYRLDKVIFPSGSYIDLDIIPDNHQLEAYINDPSYLNGKNWFGTSAGASYYSFRTSSNKYYWGKNGSEANAGSYTTGNHFIAFNALGSKYGSKNAIVLDDDMLASGSKCASTDSIMLGKMGTVANFVGAYYWCKITYKPDVELVRDLIPAMRKSDSEVGLYDLVNDVFYTNAGSGTFGYGTIVYNVDLVYDEDLGSASYSVVDGNTIQLNAVPNQNAQFLGWYVNSQKISDQLSYTYTLLADTTIDARFEPIYQITDSVDGNGAIQFTRGTDQNDVTFSVIPDANWHFVKYVVGTSEYTTTPLSLHLTADISITAYFEEDDKFHVTASTDFPYGSIYVSDNYVYSGTVVTLWARPFPDYNFVQWQDGSLENPRSIVVTQNVTLVAVYQRVGDTNGIYQYRCFVKDQLNLEDPPKAFLRVDTFTVRTDLMTNATSSITVLEMPSNINEGDVLVLYDPKGQFLYNGVITSIEDKKIGCSQMQSFYKGSWIYSTSPQDYLEHEIATVLQDYADGKLKGSSYTDQLVASRLGGITIDYTGSTTVSLPSTWEENSDSDKYEIIDMEKFIYELYEKYGIVFDFEINVSGTNYVHIKVPNFEKIKVGNNMFAIQNMLPITEIEETNRLVIYGSDNAYRTTYIATKNGIVENPPTTANRFNITNTKIVFSDDPVQDLVASNLPSQMFNHKLEYDLIIKNFIYEFGDFNLGGELDVYYGDEYYDSVLTGYEIGKDSNQNIVSAHFICGKVRTALTKLLTRGVI